MKKQILQIATICFAAAIFCSSCQSTNKNLTAEERAAVESKRSKALNQIIKGIGDLDRSTKPAYTPQNNQVQHNQYHHYQSTPCQMRSFTQRHGNHVSYCTQDPNCNIVCN